MLILVFNFIQGITDGTHNTIHCIFQVFRIPVFSGNDFFPVPLVYINRMQIIQFFIPAYCVHVGEKSLTYMKIVTVQRHTFPFRQRMYHLCIYSCVRNIKGNRAFHAI